jgi:hypothetical protein
LDGIFNNGILHVRYLKLAIVAACIALTPLTVEGQTVEAQSHSYFGRTTDPKPVHIAVQDGNESLQFKIPKVFLTFSKNWESGLQAKITLEILYPSMTAVSATRNGSAGSDVVIINLDSFANTGGDHSIPKLISILQATQWTFVENITDGRGRPYRLYVNNRDVEKRKDESRTIEEFLVPEKSEIYLKCLRQRSNPLAGCSGNANYGQTLSLSFQFKRSQFDKWPEIQGAVVGLLDSFRRAASSQ